MCPRVRQFKTQLADQLQNGIYHTERKQVEIEQTDLAPVGSEQEPGEKAPRLVKAKQLVWKTVPIYDERPKVGKSQPLPPNRLKRTNGQQRG